MSQEQRAPAHDPRAKSSRSILISGTATARTVQLAIEVDQLVVRICTASSSRFADERKASIDAEDIISQAQRDFGEAIRRARNLLDAGRRKGSQRANDQKRQASPAAPAKAAPKGGGKQAPAKPVAVAKKAPAKKAEQPKAEKPKAAAGAAPEKQAANG